MTPGFPARSFPPEDCAEPTPYDPRRISPPEQDKLFRDALWSSMLTILRSYGRRYGYCVDLKIVKAGE